MAEPAHRSSAIFFFADNNMGKAAQGRVGNFEAAIGPGPSVGASPLRAFHVDRRVYIDGADAVNRGLRGF